MNRLQRWVRRYSLRAQMVAAFWFVALVALLFLAFFYIRLTQEALIEQGNQSLFAAASRTANGVDAFINANLDAIRTEATLPSIVGYAALPAEQRSGSEEELVAANTLERLRNKDLFYIESYAILDTNGRNLLDSDSTKVGQEEGEQEYFRKPLITGLPYASPVKFAQSVGGVNFYFSNPIRNHIGQIVGVLRMQYSVAILQQLVADSQRLVGQDSFAILLDENTVRLANDIAPDEIFKTVIPLDDEQIETLQANGRLPNLAPDQLATDLPELYEGLQNAANEPFFTTRIQANSGLNQAAVVQLETQPWWVVYVQPRELFLIPIQQFMQLIGLWTLLLMVLFILTGFIVSRWLTAPIVHLTAVAEQITAGDLTAQAQVTSGDEIGRLASAFNEMTAQLRQTLQGLERREDALEVTNVHLEAALVELKEAQEQIIQQERTAAVGQLAAGIAHDFNNIMMTIILSADTMLQASDLTPDARDKIIMMRKQGQRAADLTQQILDFSRRSMMKRKHVDLRPFLREIYILLKRTMPENIQLWLEMTSDACIVNADLSRLQQVVLNLAINARNAMLDGGELHLMLEKVSVQDGWQRPFPEMEGDDWVRLRVHDTGTGIPEDVLKHIFEPFYTTRAPLGSGLGLSQVDGIVRQLDGFIDVQTEVGIGTTFTVYLPAVATLSKTAVTAQDDLVFGQNETILLVEDDPHIRDSLRMTLESLNYTVLTAANGRKALQLYQQNAQQIDLVLTDLVMPEMGGEELLTTLKQDYPFLKAVVLSGYPLSEQSAGGKLIEDFVLYQKPITLEKLSQVVAQALQT